MIKKSPGWTATDGTPFTGLGSAQKHELKVLLNVDTDAVLDAIMTNGPAVVAILSMKERAKRGKKAKAKAEAKTA